MTLGEWKGSAGLAQGFETIRSLGLETHIAELETLGLTVVPPEKAAPPELIDRLIARVTEISADRNGGVKPDFDTGATHSDIASPGGQYLSFLLAEGEVFEEALLNPVVQAFAHHLFGNEAILYTLSSMVKGPGRMPLYLHPDMPIDRVLRPLTCNATYALTDYTRENGGLFYVPGSHLLARRPTEAENFSVKGMSMNEGMAKAARGEDVRFIDPPNILPVDAPAGSLVFWNGNTWHGAWNRTAPGLRVQVIVGFGHRSLRPQEPYREMLADEIIDRNGELFARLIGKEVVEGWMEEGPEYAPGVAFERHRTRRAVNAS
jgi:ectoine hydroxylase-related dioxygenase (phytanoyl-CoA dioxygenase family)